MLAAMLSKKEDKRASVLDCFPAGRRRTLKAMEDDNEWAPLGGSRPPQLTPGPDAPTETPASEDGPRVSSHLEWHFGKGLLWCTSVYITERADAHVPDKRRDRWWAQWLASGLEAHAEMINRDLALLINGHAHGKGGGPGLTWDGLRTAPSELLDVSTSLEQDPASIKQVLVPPARILLQTRWYAR